MSLNQGENAMWKIILAAAALSLPAASAQAQVDTSPPMSEAYQAESRPMVDGFFNTLQSGDATKAYNDLFAGTLMVSKVMEIQNLVAQTNFIFQTYGPIKSWSLARSDCFTPAMCRNIYVVDTDNGPVFVVFTLYRRSTGWIPTTIFVTDISQNFFELR